MFNLKVVIKRKRPLQKNITDRGIRHAVKHLATGNTTLAIRDLLRNKETSSKIAVYFAKHIRDTEVKTACSPSSLSSLQHYGKKDAFVHFSWDELYADLKDTVLLLMTFTEQILPPTQRLPYRKAICMVAGMIMRGQSQRMNLIQVLLSIILYGGRTTASVSYVSKRDTCTKLVNNF